LDLEYGRSDYNHTPIIDGFRMDNGTYKCLGQTTLDAFLFYLSVILAIETSPIIAKLLSPKGAYDINWKDEEKGAR